MSLAEKCECMRLSESVNIYSEKQLKDIKIILTI